MATWHAISRPRTWLRSSCEITPLPRKSKKLKSSSTLFGEVICAGFMVAASQSVSWIFSSTSGSRALRMASSSCSLLFSPEAEMALRKSSLVIQPTLDGSSAANIAERSSTSLPLASCAATVRIACSKRENLEKDRIRSTSIRRFSRRPGRRRGLSELSVSASLSASGGCSQGWSKAPEALSRLSGSFFKRSLTNCLASSEAPAAFM
mmetsp:Transcript_70305/g.164931  ORF Transcript_70305/g.164931 Transcript_70305/m.164931 type:complete len:207 (+) Transcript_70305:97-717(+)